MTHEKFSACIEACIRCAKECEHCLTACLQEDEVKKMAECIRLDNDCAEICWSAAAYMSRGSRFVPEICSLCADICQACEQECKKHEADHCQKCAESCRNCADECRKMVA